MDIQNQKELSEEFSRLYLDALPKLIEFEKERKSLACLNENNKIFKERIKYYFLSEIKEIFGITTWNQPSDNDKDNLLNLILGSEIQEFHYTNKHGCHLKGELEEVITGEYKGISFKIWDMVDKILIELPSNKKIKNITRVYTKSIINYKLISLILMSILTISMFCLMIYLITINPKNIDFETFIKGGVAMFVWTGATIEAIRRYIKEKNILEDPKFCKKYYLFSEDPVEARYLVTTAFMERFKNLEKKLDTKRIQCVFYYDKIIFAINSKTNRFELADLYKKVDSPELFKTFFEEFTAIIGMIDYFKLDEKTGL